MSSDLPLPARNPREEDPWVQRPAVVATCALIIVLIGTVVWFLGREAETSTGAMLPTSVVTIATSPVGGSTVADGSAGVTAEPAVPLTSTIQLNPYGDGVGEQVGETQSQAARFSTIVQHSGDPASVAALHSPAYYYALWSRLRRDSVGSSGSPVATPSGYSVEVPGGPVELVGLRPALGPVREGAEVRGGVTTPFDIAVQSTGVCQPDREPQCDLGGANFAPDAAGSAAQMWALAKVVVDPGVDTWLLYVDLHGPRLASATVESSVHVGFDPALNVVAVTYDKRPPPGTVLTLSVTGDDGSAASFDFAVS